MTEVCAGLGKELLQDSDTCMTSRVSTSFNRSTRAHVALGSVKYVLKRSSELFTELFARELLKSVRFH